MDHHVPVERSVQGVLLDAVHVFVKVVMGQPAGVTETSASVTWNVVLQSQRFNT